MFGIKYLKTQGILYVYKYDGLTIHYMWFYHTVFLIKNLYIKRPNGTIGYPTKVTHDFLVHFSLRLLHFIAYVVWIVNRIKIQSHFWIDCFTFNKEIGFSTRTALSHRFYVLLDWALIKSPIDEMY